MHRTLVASLAVATTVLTLYQGARPDLAQAPAAAQPELRAEVVVAGDSLAVGMRPFLGAMLPTNDVSWAAESGITTPRGLQKLRSALRLLPRPPDQLVVSLGTNDGPDPVRFRARIRRVLSVVPPGTCVVWPDIVRPPRKGRYAALNRALRAEARSDLRLNVIDWSLAVRSGRVVLPDHIHPGPTGFRYRSAMVRTALQRCPTQAAV